MQSWARIYCDLQVQYSDMLYHTDTYVRTSVLIWLSKSTKGRKQGPGHRIVSTGTGVATNFIITTYYRFESHNIEEIGVLCQCSRCTGYRPILDAFRVFAKADPSAYTEEAIEASQAAENGHATNGHANDATNGHTNGVQGSSPSSSTDLSASLSTDPDDKGSESSSIEHLPDKLAECPPHCARQLPTTMPA